MLKSSLPEVAEKVSRAFGRFFARFPLTPNQWTVLSLVPAVAGIYTLLIGRMDYTIALFITAALADAIDGGVARERGEATAFGAYLDGMADRFVEAAFLFGLMLFGYPDWVVPGWTWLAGMVFFGTTMTTFSRAYADHRKAVTDQEKLASIGGTLERAERLVVILLSMLVWMVEPVYATYVIAVGVALAVLTVLQRSCAVYRLAEN